MPRTSSGRCELSKQREEPFFARASFARENPIYFVATRTAMNWRFGTSLLHRSIRTTLYKLRVESSLLRIKNLAQPAACLVHLARERCRVVAQTITER